MTFTKIAFIKTSGNNAFICKFCLHDVQTTIINNFPNVKYLNGSYRVEMNVQSRF